LVCYLLENEAFSEENNTMKHLILLLVVCISFWSNSQTIYFDKGSSKLTSQGKKELDQVASSIIDPREQLLLIGHTDSDASDEFNQTLSLNRARAVRTYLRSKGIQNKFDIEYKGEKSPINGNVDEPEKTLNRRVEIVRNHKTAPTDLNSFKKEEVSYTISPTKDTTLVCREGTKITIRKGTFANVNENDPIELSVTEYYDKGSFVLANLTTLTHDDKMLVSGGMLNVSATQNGKTLEIAADKTVDIEFRDRTLNDDMQLFNGSDTGTNIAWVAASNDGNPEQTTDAQTEEDFFSSDLHNMSHRWNIRNDTDTMMFATIWREKIKGKYYEITRTHFRQRNMDPFLIKFDTVLMSSGMEMTNLIFQTKKLGWMNCDKFDKSDAPREDFYVDFSENLDVFAVLVFKNQKAVLPYVDRENKRLYFRNIPSTEPFEVIALFKDETQMLFGQSALTTTRAKGTTVQLSPKTKEEVKALMSKL